MFPDEMVSKVHVFEVEVGDHLRISLTYDSANETGKSSAHTDAYHGRFVDLRPARQKGIPDGGI